MLVSDEGLVFFSSSVGQLSKLWAPQDSHDSAERHRWRVGGQPPAEVGGELKSYFNCMCAFCHLLSKVELLQLLAVVR